MEEKSNAEIKAARAAKKRRKQIMKMVKVGAGLGIGLAVLLYLLSAFVFFKIDTIEILGKVDENGTAIEGSSNYRNDEIIRVSGVDTGDSLVLVSKYDVEESIERLLPYIGNVKVQRKYPSTLRLTVEDTSAVYALDAGGGYILMNEDFKMLETVEKIPAGSAKIVGISVVSSEIGTVVKFSDEAQKNRIDTIMEEFAESEIPNVTKIDLSNIANVKVTIDNSYTLVLGTLTQMGKKISTATKTISAEIANNPDARVIIDLTDPNRSYVRDDYSPAEEIVSEIPDDENAVVEEPEELPEELPEEIPEAVG